MADKFLLARVESLVALAIMLSRKRLAADGAHEWSFIRVRAQMRSQIVRPREALRAEMALECGRVLLHPLRVRLRGAGALRIGKIQNVVPAFERRCGQSPIRPARWGRVSGPRIASRGIKGR